MEYFGKTSKGETVNKYWLISDKIKVGILNYGGTITDIIMPDKNGTEENIVYGFDNIEDYENKSPKFGCIIGRTAGRIAYGKFSLNNENYSMEINHGVNQHHGGKDALDTKIWKVTELHNAIELSYFSPHGENGYPGNVNFKVIYEISDNQLTMKCYAETDRDTIINLTNHSYFNLAGEKNEDCLNHMLYINADKIAKLHEDGFTTEDFMDVTGSAFDFRIAKKIGEHIENPEEQVILGSGYDHAFILNETTPQAKVCHENSGRFMEVETDQKTLVFYTGNFLGEEGRLSTGKNSIRRGAFCLETQNIPNHINIKGYDTIVTKDKPYYAQTIYRFKIRRCVP